MSSAMSSTSIMNSTAENTAFSYSNVPLTGSLMRLLVLAPSGQAGAHAPLRGHLKLRKFDPWGGRIWRVPRYEALSYVWGDQTSPETITLSTTAGPVWSSSRKTFGVLPIGRNLAAALRQLRGRNRERTLWCDSICINQRDLAERAREVRRMAHIYLYADLVLAWLGPESDGSRLAMERLAFTGSQIVTEDGETSTWRLASGSDERYTDKDIDLPFSPEEWQAIETLLDKPWFKRLWVRQEIALASLAVVVCGDVEIPWTKLKNAVICLVEKLSRPNLDQERLERYERNLENIGGLIEAKQEMAASATIVLTRNCECADDRDRVYGILGILASDRGVSLVEADYTLSTKEVYKNFTISYFGAFQELDLLQFCEMATAPSWVPDLNNMSKSPHPLPSASCEFAKGTFQILRDDRISVCGVYCGVIATSFLPVPFGSSVTGIKASVVDLLPKILGADVSGLEDAAYDRVIRAFVPTSYDLDGMPGVDEIGPLPSITELRALFKIWLTMQSEDRGTSTISSVERVVLRVLGRYLRGRSCHLTDDGSLILGPSTAEKGDRIYVILSCNSPLVLRRVDDTPSYRIIGPCFHPAYAKREALLGPLPPGWTVWSESGRMWYIHRELKIRTRQDPRLGPLPPGWKEKFDSNGDLGWLSDSAVNQTWINFDPRLHDDALRSRGIRLDRIFLI